MKKIICSLISILLIATFCTTFVSAEAPVGWSTADPDLFTINEDGSITMTPSHNAAIRFDTPIAGDFTLTVKVNTPALVDGTDQKAIVSVMGNDDGWMSGYWFRVYGAGVQFNDGQAGYAEPSGVVQPTLKTGDEFNEVTIERVGNELTYTVNGTEVLTVTPSVTTGQYIYLGGNYYAAEGNEDSLTEEITFKDLTITANGQTYTFNFQKSADTSDPFVNTAIIMVIALVAVGFVLTVKKVKA